MSLHSRSKVARFIVIVAFAFLLAFAVSNMGTLSAHAASTSVATTAAPIHTERPATVLYWYADSGTRTSPGVNLNFTVKWENSPGQYVGFMAYWGDGNSDLYTCWVNCAQGNTYYTHFYAHDGTYGTHCMSNGADSNWIYVTISG